ncbi:hypothetical protein BDF22DRAFT_126721 [Syncephalis plumigaleata]|nr:hypothetical protein BDF22DRAFT_126721 [Syncephalis plumigaleata]
MGSTFLLGTFRLLGTIMATVWSIVVLVASDPDDPYLVTILLMIHGIICWRMVYHRKTLKFAIVSLLTATSTVLIYYSGVRYGQSALVLCLERGAGVLIGLLLCIALHQLVWPFFARSELRKLLSMVIHELGQTYSIISALRVLDYDDVQSPIIYEKAAKHIHSLQTRLVRANELLQAAAAEPRLKGPFPVDVYAQMIHVIRNSMAWLVSMRSAALQSHPANIRRVMAPNIAAHRDLGAAILLYYHVVAGSLRTKLPLPAYLPSARAARKIALHSSWLAFEPSGSRETDESLNEESSLVQQQQSHTENGNTSNTSPSYHEGPRTTDMCVVYWFAYSAGLSELIRGQERIGALVRKLVGVNELMAFHDDE